MKWCGRWTGREAAAFREALRQKQEEFAATVGVSVEAVKKWERRKKSIQLSAPYAARMDRELQRADAAVVERFWSILEDPATVSVEAGHKLGALLESGADTDYVLVPARTGTGEVVLVSLPRRSFIADELRLAVAPLLVGQADAPRFVNPAAFPGGSRRRMHLVDVTQIGDVGLLRYRPKNDSTYG
ncbi:hypothetical protein [Nocardia nepalensis]|uniref:hypothetical protein n=1 Tax=Nocardia nepalensis TaxID=3375448 RepID=UPI003B679117